MVGLDVRDREGERKGGRGLENTLARRGLRKEKGQRASVAQRRSSPCRPDTCPPAYLEGMLQQKEYAGRDVYYQR